MSEPSAEPVPKTVLKTEPKTVPLVRYELSIPAALTLPGLEPVPDAVAGLRQRHAVLAERSLGEGGVPASERAALIEDLVRAGASVPNGAERDALRNMLFYWASDQAARGERDRTAPAPMLLPYVAEESATISGSSAPEPLARVLAAQMKLVPPVPALIARASASPTSKYSAGATLVQGAMQVAGAVSSLVDRLGVRPPPPRQAPPAAAAGEPDVAASAAEARRIVRISAMAREWRLTPADRKRGYLINDAATLAEAERYTNSDPEIANFVEASRAELEAAVTRRRFRLAIGLLISTLFVSMAAATVLLLKNDLRRAEAERGRAVAESANKLLADAAADRDEARVQAGAAVEALQDGDLAPLRALLQRLSSAEPSELSRLQVAPDPADTPPPAPPAMDPAGAARPSPAPRAPEAPSPPLIGAYDGVPLPKLRALPPMDGPQSKITVQSYTVPTPNRVSKAASAGCTGALWLGTKGQASRLEGGRDVAGLKEGDTVSLAQPGQLVSLAGGIDPASRGARIMASLPAGLPVTVTGAVMSPDADAVQLWATVSVPDRFCTRVFVQYAGPADRVDAVLARLRGGGLRVPPAERVPSADGLAEVRYFWPEDERAAQDAAQALAGFHGGSPLRTVSLARYPKKPSQGTIEVWLDLGRP